MEPVPNRAPKLAWYQTNGKGEKIQVNKNPDGTWSGVQPAIGIMNNGPANSKKAAIRQTRKQVAWYNSEVKTGRK